MLPAPPPAYEVAVPGPGQHGPDGLQPAVVLLPANPAPVPPIKVTEFEITLSVLQPAKRVRTAAKRTKTEKSEPLAVGPEIFNTSMEWGEFLASIAKMLSVQPGNLAINTFEWRFLKPANGAWLPVQHQTGFISLARKVATKPDPYVILRMQSPKQDHTALAHPWAVGSGPAVVDDTGVDEYDIAHDDQVVMKGVRTSPLF